MKITLLRALAQFAISGLLFGCTPTPYMQIFETRSDLPVKPDGSYVLENDTLQVRFTQTGMRGEFALEIQNKSSRPLYIDWENSRFFLRNASVPFETRIPFHDYEGSRNLAVWEKPYKSGISPTRSMERPTKKLSEVAFRRLAVIQRFDTLMPNETRFRQSFLLAPRGVFGFSPSEMKVLQFKEMPYQRFKAKLQEFQPGSGPFEFGVDLRFSFDARFSDPFSVRSRFEIGRVLELQSVFWYKMKEKSWKTLPPGFVNPNSGGVFWLSHTTRNAPPGFLKPQKERAAFMRPRIIPAFSDEQKARIDSAARLPDGDWKKNTRHNSLVPGQLVKFWDEGREAIGLVDKKLPWPEVDIRYFDRTGRVAKRPISGSRLRVLSP